MLVKTMCPTNCNPTHCGMVVTVEDGRVSIAGDRDNPDSLGFLCVRGRAAHEILDNPRRLERSLWRVGPRGSDAWEPIIWDDALNEIALAIRRAGRERVGIWPGHGMRGSKAAPSSTLDARRLGRRQRPDLE